MLFSEHMYCVAITFKMTEWVEQRICIKFCIKPEHSSPQKLFGCFRRPQLWATGDWQLHHDNTPTHASCLVQSFVAKNQITQVTQPPYNPDLAPCDFWLFPKLKSPLKGKRFSDHQWDSRKYDGADWQNCVKSQGTYQRGLRCHCPMYKVSWILYLVQ